MVAEDGDVNVVKGVRIMCRMFYRDQNFRQGPNRCARSFHDRTHIVEISVVEVIVLEAQHHEDIWPWRSSQPRAKALQCGHESSVGETNAVVVENNHVVGSFQLMSQNQTCGM